MIKIIRDYEPKNEKLRVLGSKMRLELILNSKVSENTLQEVYAIVGCRNCKWGKREGIILGRTPTSCHRPGVKKKKYMKVLVEMNKQLNIPNLMVQIPYCQEFEE